MENSTGAETNRHEWIISIKNMLAELTSPSKMSIYKVLNELVKLKEDAYTPGIVSIGPFHHGKKKLKALEEHKRRYMLSLFMRLNKSAIRTFQECAGAILDLEGDARRCYSENIDFDKHQLAEILLLDGCFLLELFLRYSGIKKDEEEKVHETVLTLQHDLALLENQIPFAVLQTLFNILKGRFPLIFSEHNMVTLALNFFKSALSLSNEAIESKASNLSGRCEHLLDILHEFYSPTVVKSSKTLDTFELPISDKIPLSQALHRNGLRDCATRLSKAGIRFAANTDDANKNLLDLKFDATDAVVTMRPFHIQEAITETIFRNLIAFEQCSGTGSTSHHISSYVFLMRSLLHSSDDVEILHEKRIIGGEDVTSLFESLCNGVVLNDSYFSKLCEDVNGYYYNRRSWWL